MSKKLIIGASVLVVAAGAAYIILKNNPNLLDSLTGKSSAQPVPASQVAGVSTVRAPSAATGDTAPVPASVPAASTAPTYFMYGDWVDTLPVKAQKTNPADGSTIYLVEDQQYTKMVDSKGNARYYVGTIADFDMSKWNTGGVADGKYMLKQCPAGATTMC